MRDTIQKKIDNKTKPTGSLGYLEQIALKLGMIQQTVSPQINNPVILVFAADHGLADEKVSPYPKEVTWQMVMNFVNGGAAINVFCRQNNIALKVIDAGVDFDFPEGTPVINAKIARGTRNVVHEPAMTIDECALAMSRGGEIVEAEAKNGSNVIGLGEMGIGNTSASSLLMHHYLGLPIDVCTGAGAGMTGKSLDYKKSVLGRVAAKHNPTGILEPLATYGGFEIAMMAGAFLKARELKMVILVDGFIASVAFLVASRFDASVIDNAIFCHASDESGHRRLLEHFNVRPLLDLGLRLGEGTGAALALPIIKAAAAFLNEMASFEDAGVSNKD